MAQSQLVALEAFLRDYPDIRYTPPSSPLYETEKKIWNLKPGSNPLAIVHPKSAEQVSALVKFVRSHEIKFTIRAGGHNLQGRSTAEGALTIDMREFVSVKVAADGRTATVGAGILQLELAKSLWDEGLATPIGSIPSVGYVGWAMYGGYGPFSSHWGLGVDQIVGVTIVNASGEIVTADSRLLKGIRGAGGVFGIIVDVSIKVYPLKSILAGAIVFDSRNINQVFVDYNTAYRDMKENLPAELTVQQMIFNAPPGRMMAISFVWSSEDTAEGRRWCEKIASLGNVIMNTVSETTIPEWCSKNAAAVPSAVYGSSRTQNVYQVTPEVVNSIGENLEKMPADQGVMMSIHQLRVTPDSNSVFASKEPHFMLEILGYALQQNSEVSEQWATNLWEDLQKTDHSNFLGNVYVSLDNSLDPQRPDQLSRLFGSHASEILELKNKYDPNNVFDLTVPRLKPLL